MSANLFDAGDMLRLEREKNLVKDVDTKQPEPEEPVDNDNESPGDNFFNKFADVFVSALMRRLK